MEYDLEWRPLPRDRAYIISENGDVISLVKKTSIIMKPSIASDGYQLLHIRGKKNLNIHAAVTEAFMGIRPEGMVVNHIDGNELNNHYKNLEYCTNDENVRHGLTINKTRKIDNILSGEKKLSIANEIKNGATNKDMRTKYNVSRTTVKRIKRKYRHLFDCQDQPSVLI